MDAGNSSSWRHEGLDLSPTGGRASFIAVETGKPMALARKEMMDTQDMTERKKGKDKESEAGGNARWKLSSTAAQRVWENSVLRDLILEGIAAEPDEFRNPYGAFTHLLRLDSTTFRDVARKVYRSFFLGVSAEIPGESQQYMAFLSMRTLDASEVCLSPRQCFEACMLKDSISIGSHPFLRKLYRSCFPWLRFLLHFHQVPQRTPCEVARTFTQHERDTIFHQTYATPRGRLLYSRRYPAQAPGYGRDDRHRTRS